jgi:hypothetical protein
VAVPPALILCLDGSPQMTAIALAHGFQYGVRGRDTPARWPYFLDLDWRKPDFAAHLARCRTWTPRFAVAGDADDEAQLAGVLAQAATLRDAGVPDVIVVPKAPGLVDLIPEEYVVGLSVPTTFGGTTAPFWEFRGRRVHLLGGAPHAQLRLAALLGPGVVSADGNSHQKVSHYGTFWEAGRWVCKQDAARTEPPGPDLPYRAFARSCRNIAAAWGLPPMGLDPSARLEAAGG